MTWEKCLTCKVVSIIDYSWTISLNLPKINCNLAFYILCNVIIINKNQQIIILIIKFIIKQYRKKTTVVKYEKIYTLKSQQIYKNKLSFKYNILMHDDMM